MNSSPTPSSPTPSRRSERQIAELLAALGLLSALTAQAHEETQAIPEQAGLRLGAALALSRVNASQALPSQRLLSWQPHRLVTVSAEAGRETRGEQRVNFTVLRAVFRGNQ